MQTGINSYRVLEHIHQSRRFIIYKAEAVLSGEIVLIKTQDPTQVNDKALADSLASEAEAALRLEHPNIRKGLGMFQEGLNGYFLGEMIEGRNLAGVLNEADVSISQEHVLGWATALAEALQYATAMSYPHLNLNPYNIIITPDHQLKVIGFGKSREAWQNSEMNVRSVHPIMYVAPEMYQSRLSNPRADIYSWGVVVYQMLCGSLPWRIDRFLSPEGQKQQSMSRSIIMPEILGKEVPDWMFTLLLSCLKSDPRERPSLSELAKLLSDRGISNFVSYDKEDFTEFNQAAEIDSVPVAEETPAPLPEPEPQEPELQAIEDEILPGIYDELEPSPLEPEETTTELQDIVLPDDFEILQNPMSDHIPDEMEAKHTQEPVFSILEDQEPQTSIIEPSEPVISIMEYQEFSPEPPTPLPPEPEPEPSTASKKLDEPKPASSEVQHNPIVTKPEPLPTQVKPAPKTVPDYSRSRYTPPDPEKEEIHSLQKTFRIIVIISIFIILFVITKYVILAPRPHFDSLKESQETDEVIPVVLEDNKAIPMITVPADTLVMGSINPEAHDNEFPLIIVPMSSFMISKTEITQAQWNMVYDSNPSQFMDPDLPVENVSFYEAVEFCNAKSLKDGLKPCYDYAGSDIICDFQADGYRLPTEAEWELAAKSGLGKSFQRFSGSDNADEVGWSNSNSGGRSKPVASRNPNSLGIFDMSGNVYEWVWNWYAPYTYNINSTFRGPANGTDKVIRGGSWYHSEDAMRATARSYAKPFTKNGYTGFRVVRSR